MAAKWRQCVRIVPSNCWNVNVAGAESLMQLLHYLKHEVLNGVDPQGTESLTNYILIEHDLAHIEHISQVNYINFYYSDIRTSDS